MNAVMTGFVLSSLFFGQVGRGGPGGLNARQLQVGDPAPNIQLMMVDGTRVALGGLRNRVVLVDFFLTS